MKREVHNLVDETLQSLDGLQRADANPYLWSKIQSRVQGAKELIPQALAWRMITALMIVVMLNLLTISHFRNEEKGPNGAASVANEYAISLPQTY